MAHAAIQQVASDRGIRVLHVKGPTVHPDLRDVLRTGSDADVLVEPGHAEEMVAALQGLGWQLRASFRYGSIFEHAATLWHDQWGYADLHRSFPGIGVDARRAFDVLWRDHEEVTLGGHPCPVPARPAQALLLLLHAARAGTPSGSADVVRSWTEADEPLRAQVVALRDELDAGLAFAAATGSLEEHQGERGYALWRHARYGGSRLGEWRARLLGSSSLRGALHVVVQAVPVNRDHLAMRLGRKATPREIALEQLARVRHALTELAGRLLGRGGADGR